VLTLHPVEKKLQLLEVNGYSSILKIGKVGIEKESLRVDRHGLIAQTNHPKTLGATLTHPHITTDYSEALLEFVTPPCADSEQAISFLQDIHQYVYPKLNAECLWPASMPCKLHGEDSIRIAEYGSSNLGLMKNIYRRGLGYRYGKVMQVIAGIHVNLSMPENFWRPWQQVLADQSPLQDFINAQYFCAIRNIQRVGWLVPYLFGASTFVDKSFTHEGVSELEKYDEDTLYSPYATSLRLGDIGYTNSRENEVGVKACYNTLSSYVDCLTKAIEKPYPLYEEIGVKVNNEYRQLNANILQIENEYYSTVRPKRTAHKNEKPTHALARRGVEYVEIRSLDLNPFSNIGVSIQQVRFMEVFFIYCLLSEDRVIDKQERDDIDNNEYEVAHHGRKPGLMLRNQGKKVTLQAWCGEIFSTLEKLAKTMDLAKGTQCYSEAITTFKPCVASIEATFSAKMLQQMERGNLSYYGFVADIAKQYCQQFNDNTLSDEVLKKFEQLASKSLQDQQSLEQEEQPDFDVFLKEYFAQAL
jgi:glutamate--cysteine ligase